MSRDTLTATVAELANVIAPGGVPAITGVAKVYPYEPKSGAMAKPTAITIDDGGMTDTDFVIVVRVYQTTDVDARRATETLRSVYQALDDLLTPYWGPTEWTRQDDPELAALIAECRLEVGREDGHLRTRGA